MFRVVVVVVCNRVEWGRVATPVSRDTEAKMVATRSVARGGLRRRGGVERVDAETGMRMVGRKW